MKSRIAILFSLLMLSACAHVSDSGRVPNSVLSNHSPAPRSMAPPPADGSASEVVDPIHMRTQADYHFAMGEALSLEGDSQKAIEAFKLASVYDATSSQLRLRLAAEYLKQGLMSESIEQAEEALRTDPQNSDIRVFLGGVYSSLRMYPQSEEQYVKILDVDPKNAEVMIYLGALAAEQDDIQKAERMFLKAAQVPENDRAHLAHFYMARTYIGGKEKDFNKAIKSIQTALSIKPDFEEAVLTLADIYQVQDNQPKANALLESFHRQFGPRKSVSEQLSQIYLEKENFTKAYEHLRELEGFDPSSLNVKVKMALILIEQKKYDDAIIRLEHILSQAPTSDKIRYYLAAVYEELENTKLAVFNYKQVDRSSTYFPDAMIRAANLIKKQGDTKGAVALMQEAVERRDDAPSLYAFYAALLDETKSHDVGVRLLEGAVKRFPENTQLLFYLGNLYDKIGKGEKSVEIMKKVIALDDKHVQALNYLAYTFAEQTLNLEEAEQLALRALDLQPNDGYILDTVGWVYFKKGQTEEAIRYLETAYRQKPNESIIAEHLGDAYYVYELHSKAKEMYLRAVALETDESKANKIRAKIVSVDGQQKEIPSNKERRPASADE